MNTRMFFLNDLRGSDAPGLHKSELKLLSTEDVQGMVADHEERCFDLAEREIARMDFQTTEDGTGLGVSLPEAGGILRVGPRALRQLCSMTRIRADYAEELLSGEKPDPDLLLWNMKRRWDAFDQGDVARTVRCYKTVGGDPIVRSVNGVNYKDALIDAGQMLRGLLDATGNGANVAFTRVDLGPDGASLQAIDLAGAFDAAKFLNDGMPGRPTEDVSFPGWDLRTDEGGGGSATVYSYLWKLICMNGTIAAQSGMTSRRAHRGRLDERSLSPLFRYMKTAERWQDALAFAAEDRVTLPDLVVSTKQMMKAGLKVEWSSPLDVVDADLEETIFDKLTPSFTRAGLWDAMTSYAHEKTKKVSKRLGIEEAAGDLLFDRVPLEELVTIGSRNR